MKSIISNKNDVNDIPEEAIVNDHGKTLIRVSRTCYSLIKDSGVVNFGVKDSKNREIGHRYKIDLETYIADKNSTRLFTVNHAKSILGETFHLINYGTRDNVLFRSLSPTSYKRFRTMKEAEKYGEKMIEKARAKALKKYAPKST